MRKNICVASLLTGVAFVSNFGLTANAYAQDANESYGINEIIVTAQKREQSIQDVPVAVTALGSDALSVNRIEKVTDLTGLAPGLIARTIPGLSTSPSFAMRGIFASASVPSQDRQISMYLDGVYVGGNRTAVFDLPDVERIEVLRGPQGTLFGRNATAGAINIVTQNPTGEFSVRQDVTVGNQDQFRTRTTVNTPQFGPFSAAVSYVHDEKRGDVRNLGAGTCFDRTNPFNNVGQQCSPRYLGSKNNESVFAALRFDNGGALTATYKFDWMEGKTTPDARTVPVINPNDPVGGMLLAILNAQPENGGQFGPTTLNPSNKRPRAYNNAWSQEGWQKGLGHNLTMDLQVNDQLSFKNITAYRQGRIYGPSTIAGLDGMELTADAVLPYATFAAGSQVPGFADLSPEQQGTVIGQYAQGLASQVGNYFSTYGGQFYARSWQFSNELQANYTSDLVTLTAGALYYEGFERNSALPGFRPNYTFMPVPSLLPLGREQILRNKTVSLAAYAQAEFAVTPELGVVLGGRITRDKKTGGVLLNGTFVGDRFGSGELGGYTSEDYDFTKTKPTYSVGLNYQPNSDILLYGKYSTAFLSGGAVADIIFPPETVKSWEAGFKADMFDRKVRFNLTGWLADYGNAQSAQSGTCCNRPDLAIIVVSNGKVKAKGFEAELNVAPFRGLSLGGSVGYTDVKQIDADPLLTQGRPTKPANAPKWAGTANITYVTPALFGDANLFMRLDTTFQTKMRMYPYLDVDTVNPSFAPYEFTKGRAIFNGRIALRDIDMRGGGNLEVGLWGKNLLDNKDVAYSFNFGDILINSSYQPARTYGLDVIVRFNP